MNRGKLYLIPSPIGESEIDCIIPSEVTKIIHSLDEFIVEDEKTARRFLKKTNYPRPIESLKLHLLNEHTPANELSNYLSSSEKGGNIGLLSDAGCPAVADPGHGVWLLVDQQHEEPDEYHLAH